MFGWLVGLIDEAYRILSVVPFLKPINKVLGGVAGFVEAIVAIGAFSIFVKMYAFDGSVFEFIEVSKILGTIEKPTMFLADIIMNIL